MLRDQVDPAQLELLDSVSEVPHGPLQVSAAENALAEVSQSESFAAEALARMLLVETKLHVPDEAATLTHMAWLRQAVDHPELADDEQQRDRLYWLLKWAPNLMLALPQVSLDEVEQGLDDLEQVFRRGGFALRPVLGFRARIAQERGDDDALREAMAAWVTEPRDRLSDCEACDTAAQGMAWERLDPARAVAAWEPLFDGSQKCAEEPQRGRAHDALLRLAAGDADGAAEQLAASWAAARSDVMNNEAVAHCLLTWVRMGNVDRALPALLARLDWRDQISARTEQLIWASATTAVLDAADAAAIVPGEVGGRPWREVRDEWHTSAVDLAGEFDARNGTSFYADRLADWIDRRRVADTPHLPPTRIRASGPTVPPRPESIAAHAEALTAGLLDFDPGVPAVLAAWVHHRDDLLGSVSPDDEAQVALLDRHAASQAPEPAALLDRAEQAARACDDEVALLRIEAERLALLGQDDDDRGARLAGIAQRLATDGHHLDAAAVWRTAARLVEAHDEAERLSLAAAEAAREDGDRAREGLATLEAARYAHASPDHALDLIRHARPLIEDRPMIGLMADDTEARLLAGAGREDDAIEMLARSLEADHSPVYATPSRLLLCDLLTDANRLDDLLPVSERVMADAVELGEPVALALGQRFHGLALVDAGRPAEALEVLDAALPVIGDHIPDLLGPLRWAHAQALTLLGEAGPARTSYAAAATAFEAASRLHEASHAQFQAGNRAWDTEDLEAAEAHYDAAIGFADGEHDPAVFAEASRVRAIVRKHLGTSGDLAELDAVPGEVRARMAEWGVEESPGGFSLSVLDAQVLRDGAHLLAGAGSHEEAAIRMSSAADSWPDEDEAWLMRAERGLFLAAAGRYDDAEQVIREALAHLHGERGHSATHNVTQRWVSILDEAGRTEDADRVYEEFSHQH